AGVLLHQDLADGYLIALTNIEGQNRLGFFRDDLDAISLQRTDERRIRVALRAGGQRQHDGQQSGKAGTHDSLSFAARALMPRARTSDVCWMSRCRISSSARNPKTLLVTGSARNGNKPRLIIESTVSRGSRSARSWPRSMPVRTSFSIIGTRRSGNSRTN